MKETAVLLTATYAFTVAALAFAWRKGGRAERAGVLLLLGMVTFSLASKGILGARFASVDPLALVEDFIGFAGFTWIGLHARRVWPLCAAALQLLSLGAHFAREVEAGVHPMVYSLMKTVPTLLVCLLVAVGAAAFRRRQRRALAQD
jgi:hypothetical protein